MYGLEQMRVLIGGDQRCAHRKREYLGHMGTTAMFQCERCEGVLTT
jgi:hypothetical protein